MLIRFCLSLVVFVVLLLPSVSFAENAEVCSSGLVDVPALTSFGQEVVEDAEGLAFESLASGVCGPFSATSFDPAQKTFIAAITYPGGDPAEYYADANNIYVRVLRGSWDSYGTNCTGDTWDPVVDSTVCPEGGGDPEPDHCTDEVLSVGETGIDCGGPCSASCVSVCPDGSVEGLGPSPHNQVGCIADAIPSDSNGNCPPGWLPFPWGGGTSCTTSVDPVLAAAGVSGVANDLPDGFSSGTFSQTEFVTPEAIVNNGDGTSTGTVNVTNTTNNSDGTTSSNVTVITTNYSGEDGTGDITGTSTDKSGEAGPESDPGNYVFGGEVPAADVAASTAVIFSDRFGEFIDAIGDAPVLVPLNAVMSGPPASTASVSVLSLGSWGDTSIDFSVYSSALNIFGWVLVGAAMVRASRLVIANK